MRENICDFKFAIGAGRAIGARAFLPAASLRTFPARSRAIRNLRAKSQIANLKSQIKHD